MYLIPSHLCMLMAWISTFHSMISLSYSSSTTVPSTVTDLTSISSVLATATPTPDAGNPANILSYPICAQICNNETAPSAEGDLTDLNVLCGPSFRSVTSACQAVTCSQSDIQKTAVLAQQLCGIAYSRNTTLGSAVSSAIASATAAAVAFAAGKDPTNPLEYPQCAQNCYKNSTNFYGCGALSNRTCVCQGPDFNRYVGPCETATCSTEDIQRIMTLAYELCAPVGGIQTMPVNSTGNSTGSSSSPSPVPFTGAGSSLERVPIYRALLAAVPMAFLLSK